MVEPKMKAQTEELHDARTSAPDSNQEEAHSPLEQEIECPRCHDSMNLCSEFDSLYYSCESCDFCLFTLKRN